MFGVKFSILVSLIYNSEFIYCYKGKGVRESLDLDSTQVIPLAEMREIIESFLFRSGKRKHILFFIPGPSCRGRLELKIRFMHILPNLP